MKKNFCTIFFMGIVLMIICGSFVCCQNNDTPDIETLTPGKLQQTAWKGTVHSEGKIYKDWNIGIQFLNEQSGGVSYYPVNTDPKEHLKEENITYSLNGKVMFFKNSSLLEGGPWTIISYNGQHLILKQNISDADPDNVAKMELDKVN